MFARGSSFGRLIKSGSRTELVVRARLFTVVVREFPERCKGDWISMLAVTLRRETYYTGQTPARSRVFLNSRLLVPRRNWILGIRRIERPLQCWR